MIIILRFLTAVGAVGLFNESFTLTVELMGSKEVRSLRVGRRSCARISALIITIINIVVIIIIYGAVSSIYGLWAKKRTCECLYVFPNS